MNTPLNHARPAEILLVEDNENDVFLTRKAFERAKLAVNLHLAKDGEECMEFLRRQGSHAGAPVPDIILLDLNMPRMDGREVLAEMVKDEALRHIPVVILTTSADDAEIRRMYELRCSSYIVKPVDFDGFMAAIRSFADYWITVVVLPSKADC